MTVGTDGSEVFEPGLHMTSQLAQWNQVMRLRELATKFTSVNLIKPHFANLAPVVIPNLSFGCEKSTALTGQM
jgi:hypothetical protein